MRKAFQYVWPRPLCGATRTRTAHARCLSSVGERGDRFPRIKQGKREPYETTAVTVATREENSTGAPGIRA